MKRYTAIGVMSGTSLDGLDMLHVLFEQEPTGRWRYFPLEAQTVAYPADLYARLSTAMRASGLDLAQLHADYGHFVGRALSDFIREYGLNPDFAAVHGHTVFHRPERRMTLQIGDELLFSDYDFCLNLGGIANISYRDAGGWRIAYDICPCNMALNHYAARLHAAYDRDGLWARSGRPVSGLKERLDALDFYIRRPPKSLGRDWFEECFLPALACFERERMEDLLHTLVEHIAGKIADACRQARIIFEKERPSMLLTGGGALNRYLRERIAALSGVELAAVNRKLIDYKEALIFAFLGLLRLEGQCNCLRTVTGASRDNIGGAVYLP